MEVMERFSDAEPHSVLVVWTDEDGNLNMKTNCLNSHGIGLAKYAENNLLMAIFGPGPVQK